jgi:hypothetical protein
VGFALCLRGVITLPGSDDSIRTIHAHRNQSPPLADPTVHDLASDEHAVFGDIHRMWWIAAFSLMMERLFTTNSLAQAGTPTCHLKGVSDMHASEEARSARKFLRQDASTRNPHSADDSGKQER